MSKHPQLVAIGQRIQEIRRKKGFSQEGFAAEAGLSRTYYGDIERGERNVAVLNLVRIAETLGVEVGDLIPSLDDLRS